MFRSRPTLDDVLFSDTPPDREKETAFWAALRLKNGVFKLTFRERFHDVNAWLIPHLETTDTLQVLDVAVSSGITSRELSRDLARHEIDHAIVAGDISATCWFIVTPFAKILLERNGYPLQYDLLGKKALPSIPGTRSGFTVYRALRLITRLFLRVPSLKEKLAGDEDFTAFGVSFQVRPLMMREVVDDPNIEVATDDLLASNRPEWIERFDLIRAANILNPDYFDDATLKKIIENLRDRIRSNGLLLVVKTQRHGDDDGTNNGTLFRKTPNAWQVVDTIGNGSPIDSLFQT